MDTQQSPINRHERRRSRRSRAAERLSFWFEDWVLVRGGEALGAGLDLARRPFEGAAWALRRGVIWPLQDRAGVAGPALAALAAILVLAAGAFALLSSGSGRAPTEPAAAPVAVATEEPPATAAKKVAERQPEPTLQGAAPVFKPSKKEKKADTEKADEPIVTPGAADPATATIGSGPGAGAASASSQAATSSTASPQSSIGVDGPPAGAKALAVAEDFAAAFVLYETGAEESKVRRALAASATPELAKSLLRRPPRLPANVKVPKAKVVNVVAGPSHGGVYTVSVSLLRIGLTSELRLDMEKRKRDWRVTNVLG